LLGISWKEKKKKKKKKTNEEAIRIVNCRKCLTTIMHERKLLFAGNQLRKSNSLKKALLIGSEHGKRMTWKVKNQVL